VANPNFPSDGQAERIDALVDTAAGVYMKLAVGSKAVAGATSAAAWHGAATHTDGSTAGGSDGVTVIAGMSGTTVTHALVDASGDLLVAGALADGAAAAGTNPVLIAGSDGTSVRNISTDASGNVNVVPGMTSHATYVAAVHSVAATSASHILVIEAPAGSPVYINRVIVWQPGTDASNAIVDFQLIRTTTAGSGGTITPSPMDEADGAYGGIVRSMGTPGSAGVVLFYMPLNVPNVAAQAPAVIIDFDGSRTAKGPVIAAGVTHGIALTSPGAAGASLFSASIEFHL
jgi:hypothetical protein